MIKTYDDIERKKIDLKSTEIQKGLNETIERENKRERKSKISQKRPFGLFPKRDLKMRQKYWGEA